MSEKPPNLPPGPSKQPLANVFQKSVSPYSKALAVHPHLYGGELYNRASELIALDRLATQLKEAALEAKEKRYGSLAPILDGIKDALCGTPKLSWWNLVTISIGHAFSQEEDEEAKNALERHYLAEISSTLTEIVRNYQSSNTKFLLEIRLTALEVDSRLIELEKIPGDILESNETTEYLSSEFHLLNKELQHLVNSPPETWKRDLDNFLSFIKKTNRLMAILESLLETSPKTYHQFLKTNLVFNLSNNLKALIEQSELVQNSEEMPFWNRINLETFLSFFSHFKDLLLVLNFFDLLSLLIKLELLFVNDLDQKKERPKIFSSLIIKDFITKKHEKLSASMSQIKSLLQQAGRPRCEGNPVVFFSRRLREQNDLHTLCAMVMYQTENGPYSRQVFENIQKECLTNMRKLASLAQPRELDSVLKSFSAEDVATRYYLLQETLLEQFISWRKQGIF